MSSPAPTNASNDSRTSVTSGSEDEPMEEFDRWAYGSSMPDLEGEDVEDPDTPDSKSSSSSDGSTDAAAGGADVLERLNREARILNKTSAALIDITKLLQFEFSRNKLSTQQILTREATELFNRYSRHGSSLRLSESIMRFFNKGNTVIRPTTRTEKYTAVSKDPKTGEERIEHKEKRVPGIDRAKIYFCPIPPTAIQTETPRSGFANHEVRSETPTSKKQIRKAEAVSTNIFNLGFNHFQCAERLKTPQHDPKLCPYCSSKSKGNNRIKSIKELLPYEVPLNHDHPFTMTTDPETHALLDPNNPDALPFYPVDTVFTMPTNTSFTPGSLEAINNIYQLTHLTAHHLLNYLSIKYTPIPSNLMPSPPAPPFALFRLGIQQLLCSNLNSFFNNADADPLGLTPPVRSLLKDLFEHHQQGRGGMPSLQSYYSITEDLRSEPWLLGREHVRSAKLNFLEVQLLQVATGAVGEGLELWWDERIVQRRAWGWLRCWVREQEVKKTLKAKRDGRF